MSVDWTMAERLAGLAAGDAPAGETPHPELDAVAARAAERVTALTGLTPHEPLPPLEVVSRAAWAKANVVTMRSTLDPALQNQKVPVAGALVLTAEIGGLVGLLSRAVLGQYELALLDTAPTPRLLLVGANLREGAEKMEVPLADLTAWVTYHEVCHAVQFTGVPWLRDHLGGLLRELLSSMSLKVDAKAMLKIPDPRDLPALWRTFNQGGIMAAVAGPERTAMIDQVQATMSLIEGHAEHVMDAAVGDELPEVDKLRAALDRRRGDRPPVMKLLFKLIGMELKMQQYEQGRAFVDHVVDHGGHAALNRAWSAPEHLPTLTEMRDPAAWLRRTEVRRLPAA